MAASAAISAKQLDMTRALAVAELAKAMLRRKDCAVRLRAGTCHIIWSTALRRSSTVCSRTMAISSGGYGSCCASAGTSDDKISSDTPQLHGVLVAWSREVGADRSLCAQDGRRSGAGAEGAPTGYLMNRISEYFGNGQRSSATIFSSWSATSRTPSIAGITLSRM